MDETPGQRAKRYREHADEIRTVALDVTHPESHAALLRLADTYDRLANRLDMEMAPKKCTG